MSTSGKSSIRKDKFSGIGNIFAEQDQKKAEFEKAGEQIETSETVKDAKTTTKESEITVEKPEQGRGVRKNDASTKKKTDDVKFFKEKKKPCQTKSVYMSLDHIAFIKEQSELNGLSFSEVLAQIIDNFKENI